MTTPTRQEIIDAYEMLDVLLGYAEDRNPDLVPTRRRIIEKALPPRPKPTMAEIEWLDGVHYLAEAENALGMRFLMVCKHDSFNIRCLGSSTLQGRIIGAEFLTPTGKRYTLTEVRDD